ncbi:MAG: 4Fe-4S dicluster domain-containing protein [Chitinivibrionales bacterium]|nr:4Fe-4S dicluster domain-containing protein [Chitinivibrionales bacterium]
MRTRSSTTHTGSVVFSRATELRHLPCAWFASARKGCRRSMRATEIDPDVCTRCGECIAECPALLFDADPGAVPAFDERHGHCLGCGHCVAVCPTNAIRWQDDPGSCIPEAGGTCAYDDLLSLLASRRSIRRYRDERVPIDEVEVVLDAMRHAPSASNRRSWEAVVITDPETIRRLSGETVRLFRFARRMLSWGRAVPFLLPGGLRERARDARTIESIDRLVRDWHEGRDRILFGAPCVVLVHMPAYGHMSGIDAGIAVTHAMLAAHARGLGTCWIGFVIELLLRRPRLARLLGIPKGRQVWGVFTLGFPAAHYHRAPPRAPVRISRFRASTP